MCASECKAVIALPAWRHLQLHPGGPHKQAFGIMNELWLSQQLCDVTLQVKYQGPRLLRFMAHKVVLASSSPRLQGHVHQAAGAGGVGGVVCPLRASTQRSWRRLIEFAYTASISMGRSVCSAL